MLCRRNEIGFAYFGREILKKLSSEGIKITKAEYMKLYDFLKNYRVQIDENPYDENLLNKIYLKAKEFLKS